MKRIGILILMYLSPFLISLVTLIKYDFEYVYGNIWMDVIYLAIMGVCFWILYVWNKSLKKKIIFITPISIIISILTILAYDLPNEGALWLAIFQLPIMIATTIYPITFYIYNRIYHQSE